MGKIRLQQRCGLSCVCWKNNCSGYQWFSNKQFGIGFGLGLWEKWRTLTQYDSSAKQSKSMVEMQKMWSLMVCCSFLETEMGVDVRCVLKSVKHPNRKLVYTLHPTKDLYYALLQIVITICNPPSLTAGRHCVPLSASFIRPLPKPLCGFGGCCAACKAQRVVLCNRGQYITVNVNKQLFNTNIVRISIFQRRFWDQIRNNNEPWPLIQLKIFPGWTKQEMIVVSLLQKSENALCICLFDLNIDNTVRDRLL